MEKHDHKVAIAIPVSVISDIPHLREKTLEIGMIGRAAAIFRINKIIVFSDNLGTNQNRDRKLITTILTYMETPQYLRKRLFKIEPELRYAGILPPLRTPHHPLEKRGRKLKVGEYREGVVVAVSSTGSLIDIGVERPVLVNDRKLPVNKRVTIKIIKPGKRPHVVLVNQKEIKTYWGYKVISSKFSFGKLTKVHTYDLVIATSKLGVPLKEISDELLVRWKVANDVLIAFGAPTHGLQEIVTQEKINLDDVVDFTVNTIPNQGTETVRTEEAVYASLAILNMFNE
jgi:predicted SPOUT superfamily RNA methylase MTH1